MKMLIASILILSIMTTNVGFAHSGGTDSNGCHAGSQPYHCHGDSEEGGDPTVALIVLGSIIVVGGIVLISWTLCRGSKSQAAAEKEIDEGFASLPTLNVLVGEDSGGLQLKWFW